MKNLANKEKSGLEDGFAQIKTAQAKECLGSFVFWLNFQDS